MGVGWDGADRGIRTVGRVAVVLKICSCKIKIQIITRCNREEMGYLV